MIFREARKADPDILAWAVELADQPRGAAYDRSRRWEDFRRVFGTPEGRRVLALMCRWAGLLTPGHVENDPYALHVREGARMICMRILAELGTDYSPVPAAMAAKAAPTRKTDPKTFQT